MEKRKEVRFLAKIIAIVLCVCTVFPVSTKASAVMVPKVTYQAHVENEGWMNSVINSETAGTTGKNYRLEALKINLKSGGKSMIQYRAHVSNIGWGTWKNSGETAGTTGEKKAIEALEIKLTGSYAQQYNIWYRTHVSDFGWTGWAKNGQTSGSVGLGVQAEAVQIKILPKYMIIRNKEPLSFEKPDLLYLAHCADYGWMNTVREGMTAGTTGEGKQMEALVVCVSDFYGNSGVKYRAHVSELGWTDWSIRNQIVGTTGRNLAMEAVEIKLTPIMEKYFDIYYRAHCADYGWLGWAKNGEPAGTTGGGLRMEAIEIKLVRKNQPALGGGTAYHDLTGKNSTSWQWPVSNYQVCGNNWAEYYPKKTDGRNYHLGVDIDSSTKDETIYAAADGVVASVGTSSANGNSVVIKHNIGGKTVYSFYGHLNSYCVSKGATVVKGQKIGMIGNTGTSSRGAHLHFAITTHCSIDTWGYTTAFKSSDTSVRHSGYTYYSPAYVVKNGRLP